MWGSPRFHLSKTLPPKKTSSLYTPTFLSLFYLSVLNCFIFVLVLKVFYLCLFFVVVVVVCCCILYFVIFIFSLWIFYVWLF